MVTVVIHGQQIHCANLGDSRAVLASCRKNAQGLKPRETIVQTSQDTIWVAHPLSRDHKPDCEDERQRIEQSGGRVQRYRDHDMKTGAVKYVGPARVYVKHDEYPGLAMSRSIGDLVAHSVGVSAEPELYTYTLDGDQEDNILLLASDGLWEFISTEEALRIVLLFYLNGLDPSQACQELTREAVTRWR